MRQIVSIISFTIPLSFVLAGCSLIGNSQIREEGQPTHPLPSAPPSPQPTDKPPPASLRLRLPRTPKIEPTQTPDPQGQWIESPPGSLVVDVHLRGGQPFLPFVGDYWQALNRLVIPAIYAELARLDAAGNYFPYLASRLPTLENGLARFVGDGENEQLEVEFPLRPGLTWQDGQPLTAEDLAFSWELVIQPDWPGVRLGRAGSAPEVYVDSVEAPAPDRVIYRFMSQRQARQAARDGGRPGVPTLYAHLAAQVGPIVPLDYLEVGRNVFPRHLLADIQAGQIAASEFARNPVYAGAYRLVEGEGQDRPVVLEAWEGFALGKPAIERVVFGPAYYSPAAEPYWQTPEKLVDAFPAGAIQAQLSFRGVNSRQGADPRAFDILADQGMAQVIWASSDQWEVLDFNHDNSHLADLQVRRAIAHALDRQAIIDLALAGHGDLMRSYLTIEHPLYAGDVALPYYGFDPGQARAMLQEAGYDLSRFPAEHPTRGPLTLRLASMDVASYPRQGTAALIQEQLVGIGIQVEIQFYEWPQFEGDDCEGIRNGREFDLGMAGWLGATPPFPIQWVELTTASASIPTVENGCPFIKSNWSGWNNPRVDEILPQLRDGRLALEQPEVYRQLWVEHQVLWANELPSLPLFDVQRPVVVSQRLSGVQISPFAIAGGVEDTWNIFEWVLDE
jgi:peptide/nickel transport system substrate-binding protein